MWITVRPVGQRQLHLTGFSQRLGSIDNERGGGGGESLYGKTSALAAAKMLQHLTATYSISYVRWLQLAAEYGSCSQ